MANSRISTSSIVQGFPKSKSLLAGNDAIYSGSYESIATVDVGAGGQSTITFSSIPSTYTHLQIRFISRGSNTDNNISLRFNSDTSSNYYAHFLYGDGSSAVAANSGATTTLISYISQSSSSRAANAFSSGVIDVLDYANTSKYKTMRSLSGRDDNSAGIFLLTSGLWMSTSAVSTITLTTGANFNQYSSFALYGIK